MSLPSPLRLWAKSLIEASAKSVSTELRITDALAAYIAGLNTSDGKAVARLYAKDPSESATVSAVSAIARQSECDDIELSSCVTPGAVVIPVALACAHRQPHSAIETAIGKGYEAGIICGRALGGAKALPRVWPTLIAAPLMAAVTVSFLRGYDCDRLVHAMALALAGSSGVAGRPSGAPSGRWVAFAEAVSRGMRSANAAGAGFRGDPELYDQGWWQAQSGHSDLDSAILTGPVWPDIDDTDYKPFPIARQAATAVEAFQHMLTTGIDPNTIQTIEAVVPGMNAALLTRPAEPNNRTTLLCNLGFQFACAAWAPELLYDPERRGATAELIEFSRRTTTTPTAEFERRFPGLNRWPARVTVHTTRGSFTEELDQISLGASRIGLGQLNAKWEQLFRTDDRRDFFANVVNRPPASHAMLWAWVQQRLANSA